MEYDNVAIVELTGDCNKNAKEPGPYSPDILLSDDISYLSNMIAVVVYQIPNCPLRFSFDPKHTYSEDGLVSQTMR